MTTRRRPARSELEQAFLDDHRTLLRGLKAISRSLAESDLETACAEAVELDRAAGAHMRFEEEEFYPALRAVLGDEYVDRLYHEHADGQQAIRRLVGSRGDELSALERDETLAEVRATLEHAVSCGTLLSHLASLAPSRQAALLDRLYELRSRGQRWSEYDRAAR